MDENKTLNEETTLERRVVNSTSTSKRESKSTKPVETNDTPSRERIVPKDIDPNQYVVVRNGFHGRLVYKSKKTGETFVWTEFGSEQEMELRELKNAKNSSKKFFINNWFMFDENWIVDYLGVRQFYKNAVSIEEFDEIFTKSADEIIRIVSHLSPGQRKSAAYRARQLIVDGLIDSHKAITALEESLGIELIER